MYETPPLPHQVSVDCAACLPVGRGPAGSRPYFRVGGGLVTIWICPLSIDLIASRYFIWGRGATARVRAPHGALTRAFYKNVLTARR